MQWPLTRIVDSSPLNDKLMFLFLSVQLLFTVFKCEFHHKFLIKFFIISSLSKFTCCVHETEGVLLIKYYITLAHLHGTTERKRALVYNNNILQGFFSIQSSCFWNVRNEIHFSCFLFFTHLFILQHHKSW